MLRVIYAEKVQTGQPGDWFKALITTEEELEDNYVTGADVDGMNDDDRLAAGSVIMGPGFTYVAYENEVFIQRS